MTTTTKFTVHGVLAGAYAGKNPSLASTLTHASTDGGNSAICGNRVKEGSLCDLEEEGAPTCPRCAVKLAKLAKVK
jgi:hypothetical protein